MSTTTGAGASAIVAIASGVRSSSTFGAGASPRRTQTGPIPNSSISISSSAMRSLLRKRQTHDDCVLARAMPRGVIVLAASDGREAKTLVELDRARIGRPHFEQHAFEL